MGSPLSVGDASLTEVQRAFLNGLNELLTDLRLTRLSTSASHASWSDDLGLEVRLEHSEDPRLLILVQVDPTDEVDIDFPRLEPRNPGEAGIRVGFDADVSYALEVLGATLSGGLRFEILERGGREVEIAIFDDTRHGPELVDRVRFGVGLVPIWRADNRPGSSTRVERIPAFL